MIVRLRPFSLSRSTKLAATHRSSETSASICIHAHIIAFQPRRVEWRICTTLPAVPPGSRGTESRTELLKKSPFAWPQVGVPTWGTREIFLLTFLQSLLKDCQRRNHAAYGLGVGKAVRADRVQLDNEFHSSWSDIPFNVHPFR